MASVRQIEANRRNALLSSGPKTEVGKKRSRCNAVRHGLTAETVVDVLEDSEDYKAFELSVTADFDVQTAVERELVLRLASLLWRLRRATAIETGLLQIQSEMLRDVNRAQGAQTQINGRVVERIVRLGDPAATPDYMETGRRSDGGPSPPPGEGTRFESDNGPPADINATLGRCFLRLANLDNGAFERLSRYETALWRQVGQLLITLEMLQRR